MLVLHVTLDESDRNVIPRKNTISCVFHWFIGYPNMMHKFYGKSETNVTPWLSHMSACEEFLLITVFFRVKGQMISSTKKTSKVADAKAFLLQISVTKISWTLSSK